MLADGGEGLLEAEARFDVDLLDELLELLLARRQILDLVREEGAALLELVQLADCI